MARLARVLAVGIPHHVTQRGHGRAFILDSDNDRLVYRNLLEEQAALHGVALVGYCLMSNHVHLIAIPCTLDSLALTMKHTHGRFASYRNAAHRSTGHVWQGRYYSCPLDELHLWEALRYTELNPVRAGIVTQPERWPWSSANVHCNCIGQSGDPLLDLELWQRRWTATTWREYLDAATVESMLSAIRRCTHTGRPLGSAQFVRNLETSMKRKLAPEKGGRPPGNRVEAGQQPLSF